MINRNIKVEIIAVVGKLQIAPTFANTNHTVDTVCV